MFLKSLLISLVFSSVAFGAPSVEVSMGKVADYLDMTKPQTSPNCYYVQDGNLTFVKTTYQPTYSDEPVETEFDFSGDIFKKGEPFTAQFIIPGVRGALMFMAAENEKCVVDFKQNKDQSLSGTLNCKMKISEQSLPQDRANLSKVDNDLVLKIQDCPKK